MIAGIWEDIDPEVGGSISYQTVGNAPDRQFIVQFTDVQTYGEDEPPHHTFQFVLFEGTNTIQVNYKDVTPREDQSTAGIENATGTHGIWIDGFSGQFLNWSVHYSPPIYSDSDLDLMPDEWEISFIGSTAAEPSDDLDGDGLTNLEEFERNTRPLVADSDEDGYPDGQEVGQHSDPTDPDSIPSEGACFIGTAAGGWSHRPLGLVILVLIGIGLGYRRSPGC